MGGARDRDVEREAVMDEIRGVACDLGRREVEAGQGGRGRRARVLTRPRALYD